MYAAAMYLTLTRQQEASSQTVELEDVDAEVIEATLFFMYNGDYSDTFGISPMVFHAKVYSIGHRYIAPTLQLLAKDKFRKVAESSWALDDFLGSIAVVYNTTPDSERSLRDIIVQTSRKSINTLAKDTKFKNMLNDKAAPGFAADIVLSLPEVSTTYSCPACLKTVTVKGPPQILDQRSCFHCNSRAYNWKDCIV